MRTRSLPLWALMLFTGVLLISGCKKKNDPTPLDQQQMKMLTRTWTIQLVELDGADTTAYYNNFKITISGTTPETMQYTITGRPHYSPWPDSGKIVFGENVKSTIIRDRDTNNELVINYLVTDTSLEFDFIYAGSPYNARTVDGEWHFAFGL